MIIVDKAKKAIKTYPVTVVCTVAGVVVGYKLAKRFTPELPELLTEDEIINRWLVEFMKGGYVLAAMNKDQVDAYLKALK